MDLVGKDGRKVWKGREKGGEKRWIVMERDEKGREKT